MILNYVLYTLQKDVPGVNDNLSTGTIFNFGVSFLNFGWVWLKQKKRHKHFVVQRLILILCSSYVQYFAYSLLQSNI